jgi:lysophospholipase L1-like esterase
VALVGIEAFYAVLRPVPFQPEFDPSGSFGSDEGPPLRVAVLGDSTVTSPGVVDADDIWIRKTVRRLASDTGVELRSFAAGGSRAADIIAVQLDSAIAFTPHLAFVSVGANDVIRGVSLASFRDRLDTIVGRLTEEGATVIQSGVGDLGTIPRLQPPLRNIISQRSRRFNAVHLEIAERHGSAVVDHWNGPGERFYSDPDLWSADHFHVNPRGHDIWAEATWATVEPLLPHLVAAR